MGRWFGRWASMIPAFSGLLSCGPQGGAAGSARSDAGAEQAGQGSDAGRKAACVAEFATGACRALGVGDLRFVHHGGVVMPAGLVEAGGLLALGVDVQTGELVAASAQPGQTFAAQPTPGGITVFDGSTLQFAGSSALYFSGRKGTKRGLYSINIAAGRWGEATEVLVDEHAPNAYWPQVSNAPDAKVLLSFADPSRSQAAGHLARSDSSGLHFAEMSTPVPSGLGGLLVHASANATGDILLAYQQALPSGVFRTYVHMRHGEEWSSALALSTASSQVHDAYPVLREDGDFDVYYLRDDPEDDSFSVYRRHVRSAAEWGPEQRVTEAAIGHVEKPQFRRLPSLGAWLLFSVREGSEYGLAVAPIASDAPR